MQTQTELPGTVIPAGTQTQTQGTMDPTGTPSKNSRKGCQNRSLRMNQDAPTHLANGVEINWADSRFLRAFNEFATSFEMSD